MCIRDRLCAHQESQDHTIATSPRVRVPRSPARLKSETRRPSSVTSRQPRLSVPEFASIAVWNFSAPDCDCRHWKNIAPSEPRATCPSELRAISPGRFAGLYGCQLTPDVACSSSSHGPPPATERVRSAASARFTCVRRPSVIR